MTKDYAERVAELLWPEKATVLGMDCRAEIGREGEPCRICADANAAWLVRVERVRDALERARAPSLWASFVGFAAFMKGH
jgi:hypothetical protein